MKTPARSALAVVAAAVLAYPAAAWLLGQRIESAIDEQYRLLDGQPYVKVIQRDYQRGVFSATETVTFEFAGDLLRSIAAARREPGAAPAGRVAAVEPPRLTVRTEIQHGPLPGLSSFGAGTADSELVFDEATRQGLARVFGAAKPLALHTDYRFDGGGRMRLASPEFMASLPSAAGGAVRLSSAGVSIDLDFSRALGRYTLHGAAPKLELADDRMRMTLSGLAIDADQSRVFADEPLLYAGTQKLAAAELEIVERASAGGAGQSAVLKGLSYDVAVPVKDDFVDIVARLGAETARMGDRDYGPAHYDLSLRHLHARTVAKLYRALTQVYGDPALLSMRKEDVPAAMAPLAEPARELLAFDPEFSIDRVSFNSPYGEAAFAARARLPGMTPADGANPLVLMARLDASGEVSLPEPLLLSMPSGGAGSEEERLVRARMMRARIDALAAQGYVRRDGGVVKSALAFRNGQLTVNGRPFNPLAAAAAE